MGDDDVKDDDFVMALLAEDIDGVEEEEEEDYKAAAAAKNDEVQVIDVDDDTAEDGGNHKSAAAKGKQAKGKSTTTTTSTPPRPKLIRVLQGKQARVAKVLQEDKKVKRFFVEWTSNSKKEWIPQAKWAIETIESDNNDDGRKSRLAREKRPFRYVPPTEETNSNSNSNSNSNASSSNGSSRKKSKQTHAAAGVDVEGVEDGANTARQAPLKKTTSSNSSSATSASSLVGQKVAKYFEGDSLYFGTITATKRVKEVGTSRSGRQLFKQCWHIKYDDGDEEDMEREEVHEVIALYHEHQQQQEQKEKEKEQKSNPAKATKGKKTSSAADRFKSPEKKRTGTTRHGKDDKVAVPHAVTPPPPSASASASTTPTTPTAAAAAAAGNPLDGVVKRFSDSFPYKGAKVAKFFDKTLYYGTVVSCLLDEENTHIFERVSKMTKKSDEVLPCYVWHVRYNDGDQEDLDLVELQQGLELYRSRRIKGYKSKSSKDATAAAAAASSTQKDNAAEEGSSEDAADGIDTDTGTYWEVDDILERRFKKMAGGVQVVQYLVKWKGWRDEKGNDSTWVPAECLDKNSLKDAWEKFPEEIEELKTPPNEGKTDDTIMADADTKPLSAEGAMDTAATDINASSSTGETADTDAQKGPTNEATNGNAKIVSTDEEAAGASAEKDESAEAASNFDGTNGKESEVAQGDEADSDSSKTRPTVSETSGSANVSNADQDDTKEPKKSGPDVVTRATRLSATMAPVPVQEKKPKKHRKENFNDSDSEDDEDDDDIEEGDYNRTGGAEIVIGFKTYRYGNFYKADDGSVLRIVELNGKKQTAICQRFLPSTSTFLKSIPKMPKDCFLQFGKKDEVALSKLKRSGIKPPTCDWIYEFDPEREHSSFCYYQKGGKVPPRIAGKTKPKVLELFAGAGGMSVGFHNAGMQTRWVVESNESAAATLRANHKGENPPEIYTEDIRDFLDGVRKGNPAYPSKEEVDHIHGSPPCQGFSRANRVGGEEADENNGLTREFIHCIRDLEPLTATYENVPGILQEKTRGYLQWVITELMDMNYQVRVEVLKASDFGDPQNRRRVILWAAKCDENCQMLLPSAPKATHGPNLIPRRTVQDAIGCLDKIPCFTDKKGSIKFSGTIDHNFRAPDHLPDTLFHVSKANKPSRTVTGVPLVHYNGDRYMTVRESALLQSFPWDYTFIGSTQEQYKQVGNAVPCMMATHVARAVAKVHGLA